MEAFCNDSSWPQIDQGACPDTDHQLDSMFSAHQQQHQLGLVDDFRVLAPDFDEDDEMAAARDVVTADLKCLQECGDAIRTATPPPPMHPQHHLQGVYLKQEASGAAGSSCGASSPQASCDTAAAHKAQQFWAAASTNTQQQHCYDATGFSSMLPGPSSQYAPPAGFMSGLYASTLSMAGISVPPCTGPCCYPQAPLVPQGSCSLSAGGPADCYAGFSPQGGMGGFSPAGAMHPAAQSGLPGSMIPHGAFALSMARTSSAPPAALAAAPQPPMQRGYGSYPGVLQGGVQKRSSTAGAKASAAAADAAPAPRKSVDGSCSSKDGSPAPAPRPKKGSRGATAAAGGSGSGGRMRTSSSSVAAAVAVSGSASSVIKELQQEIEALTASKAELKTQVRTLLTSQTDLLTRVATLTTKWQQAVAENAALHRQNLQLAARQCL